MNNSFVALFNLFDKGEVLTISLRGIVAELHKPGVVVLEGHTGRIVPALPDVQQFFVAPGVGHDVCEICKMKNK